MSKRLLARLKRLDRDRSPDQPDHLIVRVLRFGKKDADLPPPTTSVGDDGRLFTVITEYADGE